MDKEKVTEFLVKDIAELLLCEKEEIETDASLTEELGIDSIEMQELYLKIKKRWNIPWNLVMMINDTALVIDRREQDADLKGTVEHIQRTMRLKLTRENKADLMKKLETESSGKILSDIQGYVTVDMLAESIASFAEEEDKDA